MTTTPTSSVYGLGTLAYIDSFAGLVPCKVTDVENDGSMVSVVVTAHRPGWSRGETVRLSHNQIVPRDHIFTRGGIMRVRGGYAWAS